MDKEIKSSLLWFLSFTTNEGWVNRRSRIEKALLERVNGKGPTRKSGDISVGVSVMEDATAWYLYLVESFLSGSVHYEPIQGARIVPMFKRFGRDLELLQRIEGIEHKIKFLFKEKNCDANAVFFEIMTALLWARNGYKVAFIDARPSTTTPDLRVEKDGKSLRLNANAYPKVPSTAWTSGRSGLS